MEDHMDEDVGHKIGIAFDMLPESMTQSEIVAMVLTLVDAYSEDDKEMFGFLCGCMFNFAKRNGYTNNTVIDLMKKVMDLGDKETRYH